MKTDEPFRLPGVDFPQRAPSPLRFPLQPTPEMTSHGISLRMETPGDIPFIRSLYAGSRAAEMIALGNMWDRDTKQDFVEKQFSYQYIHHTSHYPGADYAIILRQGRPVGRIYLYWSQGHAGPSCRLFDFLILPDCRDMGIGSMILAALLRLARSMRASITLNVDTTNPARRLYSRFGFVEEAPGFRQATLAMRWQDGPISPGLRLTG
ncbi:GCN5 family acetyltransferase [Azospirillum sp. TSH100]|uniref:GNAT family N-acetyltransferase n=1 Tax=Azospirillum sp. TSH100 TaxID=652764 RepID=UPI000D622C9C|nr:GNAT family N-acetyltransferase [Azospirillum sp. TSH100]PWC88090.1 GCN5 family acetyltransferase [Azospirillum sp. TSH100]QCG92170.1 GNAT family N-acetyltransferase [Azospirillum sp. TSH100]